MFHPKTDEKILLVHCRKGLFTITKCQSCGHVWTCPNCQKTLQKGVNLVAYRSTFGVLELLCHQCQTYYKYPLACPECHTEQVISKRGGIDDLHEQLETSYGFKVVRLDGVKKFDSFLDLLPKKNNQPSSKPSIWLTTRIYDPAIDYTQFTKVIYIQAQNLLASSDYLVQEEITNNIGQVLLQASQSKNTEIVFDTPFSDSHFFNQLRKLLESHEEHITIWDWFTDFIEKENNLRKIFGYPPFTNLILLTSHEKTFEKAKQKLQIAKTYLEEINNSEKLDLKIKPPYPARFLKRKGLFSYHILIKYPREYKQFSKLKKEILSIASSNNLQVRHNPRHLF